MINSRKAMVLLTKSMFAIFMVMFVFLVFFIIINSRVSSEKIDSEFDFYDKSNTLLQAVLANSNCISVGNLLESRYSTTVRGMLDANKLELLHMENKDLWCVESFDLIYNIEVEDEAANRWLIGPVGLPSFAAERKIRTTLPSVVRFDNGIVHSAKVSINVYTGRIPSLYGAIKRACTLHETIAYPFESEYDIMYFTTNNTFYIGKTNYFSPYFSCEVSSFRISKGKNIVYLEYDNAKLSVKT